MEKTVFVYLPILLLLLFCSTFSLEVNGQSNDELISSKAEEAYSLLTNKKRKEAIKILEPLLTDPAFAKMEGIPKSKVYHKLGVAYYLTNEFVQAIEYLDQAIEIRTSSDIHSIIDIAKSLYLRALAKHPLNYNQEALADVLRAIEYLETSPQDYEKDLAKYYKVAANSYRELGDLGKAEQYYQTALLSTQKVFGEFSKQMSNLYNSFGTYYREANQPDKALEMYQKALDILYQFEGDGYMEKIITRELNIGVLYFELGKFEKARDVFEVSLKQTRELQRKSKDAKYNFSITNCLNNLAFSERKLGRLKEAEAYYADALKVAKIDNPNGKGVNQSRAEEGLANVYVDQEKYDTALDFFHRATKNLCRNFNTNDIYSLPSIGKDIIVEKVSLKRVLAAKADALVRRYHYQGNVDDLERAHETYKVLDSLIVNIRQSYESNLSRYDIVEGTIAIYEKAALAAIALYEKSKAEKYLEAAFQYSSKNKAVVLLEGLQDENAKFAGIPKALLQEENDLKKEFYQIETKLFDLEQNQEDSLVVVYEQKRFEAARAHQRLIDQFEESYPEYYQLKYTLSNFLGPASIASQIPDGSALVEYFIGVDSIFIFTLSQSGLQYYVQGRPDNFKALCQQFRASSEAEILDSREAYIQPAYKLYQLLLKKPLADLESQQDIDRLFIIPDDYLLRISFDGLLSELSPDLGSSSWSSPNYAYLLRQYAISYAYSNQLLFNSPKPNQRKRKASEMFAGFGIKYDDFTLAGATELRGTREGGMSSIGQLGQLPFSIEEITEIAPLFSGDYWLDQEATKANFINNAPNYKILHMAMHGVMVEHNPLNSALIFSRTDESSDFLLRAGDLYSLTLNADLAVLSACNTGSGQLQKGEGVMTLARAFNYAGCPSLVASLWNASDKSTKDLMVKFYEELKTGLPKDIALQNAKLAYLEECPPGFSTPSFWTHMTLIGDMKEIDFATSILPFSPVLPLAGILVILMLWWIMKKRNKSK